MPIEGSRTGHVGSGGVQCTRINAEQHYQLHRIAGIAKRQVGHDVTADDIADVAIAMGIKLLQIKYPEPKENT